MVIDGEITIRPMMKVVFTMDHRYGDAAIAINMLKVIKAFIEDPENFDISKFPDRF